MELTSTGQLYRIVTSTEDARAKAMAWHTHFSGLSGRLTPADQSRIARWMDTTTRSVRRQWAAWNENGRDPAALIDRRLSPDRSSSPMTSEFIEFWKSLCEENARSSAAAYRALRALWRSGKPIPGVSPELRRSPTLPRGFSRSNLYRHLPTKFALRSSRVGRQSAAAYRPLVSTTRVGMEVGTEIMFDDMWHDFQVVVLGQRKPSRLLQLHAHDVFSACQFARGIKPRVEDPETGRSVQLDQGDMLFLTAHCLGAYGYNPSGTRLMLESGTAALPREIAESLERISGGKVVVVTAPIQNRSAFAGQYLGSGKGNFRFKSHLESSHSLIHAETANMLEFAGQTGSNSRINAPEQLHGRAVALNVLTRAMAALPPELVSELRLPFVEATKAIWAIEAVMERINGRTDHDLEGWVEAGLTALEYDLPGGLRVPALQVAALDPDRRAAIEAVAQPSVRKLSPREVFEAGRRKLVRFRPEQAAALLVNAQGREVVVGHNHMITVEDKSLSPSPIRYLAHTLAPGDAFRCVINPFELENCHLFDARERWVGTLRAWQAVSRIDQDGIRAQIAEASEIHNLLLKPIADRGARQAAKRLEDLQVNIEKLSGHLQSETDLGAAADAALQNLL